MSKGKTVGELNGANAVLFQLFLRTWPVSIGLLIGLNAWIVRGISTNDKRITVLEHEASKGERFTAADAAKLETHLREWHTADIERRLRQ